MPSYPPHIIAEQKRIQIRSGFFAAKLIAVLYCVTMLPTLGCEWHSLRPIVKNGVYTQGHVSLSFPQDHCTCEYIFHVDGVEYKSNGRSCCSVGVGNKIDVFYARADPSNSVTFEPVSLFWDHVVGTLIGLILMPSVAYFGAYFKSKPRILVFDK